MDYHFSDFTEFEYRELIRLAKSRFQFLSYPEILDASSGVLWRHDVDISMHRAKALAQIEKDEGVTSTYFIYPHCEFYNLLEKEIFLLVKDITAMGHRIGLHFDSHFYGIEEQSQLEEKLLWEKQLLEHYFDTNVEAFSFHNNNDFTLGCENWRYANMINTYANYFKKEVGYCSDSHGIWRFHRLKDFLCDTKLRKIQVLTHPEWWQPSIMSPRERVLSCISGRARKSISFYDDLLIAMNRPNI